MLYRCRLWYYVGDKDKGEVGGIEMTAVRSLDMGRLVM